MRMATKITEAKRGRDLPGGRTSSQYCRIRGDKAQCLKEADFFYKVQAHQLEVAVQRYGYIFSK